MIAKVGMWGSTIGVVSMPEGRDYASFEYDPTFLESGIQVAPLKMPLSREVYEFPSLSRRTFHGLPGLLADSLPDKFGNAVIDAWLATQGRRADSFGVMERLCYTGKRGMGALEYAPSLGPRPRKATKIGVDSLVQLASDVLSHRELHRSELRSPAREHEMRDILRVGTSAGGARAKAIIAWNPATNEVRSGQVEAGDGFEYWLLKFDGVSGNMDKELMDPAGYGVIEYAYYLMAKAAGITMSECRLLEENHRRHFMTRRFDRLPGGGKLHMQSLGALAHFDFNQPGDHSYEQAFLTLHQLELPTSALEELFRRMVFNIVARNQDDHVKNIAFLMDRDGQWALSPAFDMIYSYNPSGSWTGQHQMSLNGKRDSFTKADFKAGETAAQLKRGRGEAIVKEVITAVKCWPEFAKEARMPKDQIEKIQLAHRLKFPTV